MPHCAFLQAGDNILRHIDHGYAMTSYVSQGKTRQELLYHQESTQKHLANQKDFLVALTRPEFTVTLYTDHRQELLKQIERHTGEKTSALEVIRQVPCEKRAGKSLSEEPLPTVTATSSLNNSEIPITPQGKETYYQAQRTWTEYVSTKVVEETERVVKQLLGEPKKQTTQHYLYGSKNGSLKVTLRGEKRGCWFDFQSGQGGHLFDLIAQAQGLNQRTDFPKVVDEAARLIGLSRDKERLPHHQGRPQKPTRKTTSHQAAWTSEQQKRMAYAQKLVAQSKPIEGTLAERYCREHRHIEGSLPPALRYHPNVYASATKTRLPALLAIAENAQGKVQSVQTIFLDKVTGNKANIDPVKVLVGPIKGALVTLQEGKDKHSPTLIAEGVETGLSLKQAAPDATIKVTLGVSNFLSIPPQLLSDKVIFCLDNDGVGSASRMTAERAMDRLAELGKSVFYNEPVTFKTDYNDLLKEKGIAAISQSIKVSLPFNSQAISLVLDVPLISINQPTKTTEPCAEKTRTMPTQVSSIKPPGFGNIQREIEKELER